MVHKNKAPTDEMDEYIADMDRQQDEYVKSMEADLKRTEEDWKKQMQEAEAFAKGTVATVKGLGEKAHAGVEKIKGFVKKLKKPKEEGKWYGREPVQVYPTEKEQKKAKKAEKEYVRLEEY
jgi:hypothetical protein